MTSQFEQGHSPAVRAVLNAYRDASWAPDTEDPNKHHKWSHKSGLAAVLRALADQVVPRTPEPAGSKPTAAWHRWNVTGALRLNILSIASELEAP